MAFTSKVVVLLVVSSLAWCQASAKEGSANTIFNYLNKVENQTNKVVSAVNKLDGGVSTDISVLIGYINAANEKLKTVSNTSLSDSDRAAVFQASSKVSILQFKLLNALIVKVEGSSLRSYGDGGTRVLEKLRVNFDRYGNNLLKFFPNTQIELEIGMILLQEVTKLFHSVIALYFSLRKQ